MSDLSKIKQELREALPKKGISFLIKSLKGLLPAGTPKYDIVIALEAEHRQLKLDTFGGVLSQEDKNLRESQLRKRILELVSSLEEADFDTDTEHSILADKQKIRRGHVLYRIPQQMQLQEESRCLVRIAFDKAMIVEELDLDEDTELRSEVRISDYMKVEIEDPSADGVFAIRTTSEEVQFIDEDDFTEWHFYVKPLVPGEHSLEVKVSVILRINGEDRIREKTLEESVVVITEAPAKQDEDQAFSQLEEAFVVSDESATSIFDTRESAVFDAPMIPPMGAPVSEVFQPRNFPEPQAPPASAAPSRKSKSKGTLIRNISMVLVLVMGFTFAFNLFKSDQSSNISEGDTTETLPHKSDNDLQYESLILGNWQVAAIDLMQEDTALNAIEYDPSFAAIMGASYLFQQDNFLLVTLTNGYAEYIAYDLEANTIQLAVDGYQPGKINQLDDRSLIFTLPFVNELGTFYLRYTLYK
jgi:hypothetical protein